MTQRIHIDTHVYKVTQLCPSLCGPMDCSPPASSVRGVLQARILEWVAMPSSGGSSGPRIEAVSLRSPASAGRFFTTQPHTGKPHTDTGTSNSTWSDLITSKMLGEIEYYSHVGNITYEILPVFTDE